MIDARKYTAAETLRDRTPVTIRAIRRDDSNRILAAFDRLDRESVYTRFFTYKKGLADAEPERIDEFFRYGMWLNVAAAMGVEDLSVGCEWVRAEQQDPQ